VIPGASDKVIFYFQGGGACWDETSTKLGFCTSDSSPQSLVGIFDRMNANNRFKDYTIVQVLYCSGDVFGGNVTRPYNDKDGVPVQQNGLANAQSVLDWTVKQQATGGLASTLSELVVMGCSAGSIGAQLWAKQVLTTLKWTKAAVVPDSYAGIFPEGTTGPLVYNYGFCTSGFLSPDLYAKCMNQTITMQDMDLEFISATPTVPYTFIQSKTDDVQMSFYIMIGLTSHIPDPLINPTEFYDDVNEVFGLYNAELPNFVTYLVDGYHHCFTNQDLYYTADAQGPDDAGSSNSGMMLSDWTNVVPLSDGQSQNTVCEGDLQRADKVKGQDDNDYCSTTVSPKQYVEQY
jgi:hypothetical protein